MTTQKSKKKTTTTTTTTSSTSTSTSSLTALEKCQQARQLWLSAKTEEDLQDVENLYRAALNSQQTKRNHNKNQQQQPPPHKKKKQKVVYAELTPKEYRSAAERLSLLYCQSGRTSKAKKGLEYLGFQCRLAESVLNYPMPSKRGQNLKKKKKNVKHKKTSRSATTTTSPMMTDDAPCGVYNHFLNSDELEHLRSVFLDPNASYWTTHDYQVEPPSPYFSYVIPLHHTTNNRSPSSSYGFLGSLIDKIRHSPQIVQKFPNLQKHAKFVELWAHNRPHASGHQLHFDSDDEGRGGVRNPIISTILYLTDMNTGGGGPSLVTNQKLSSTHLATKGWLAHPACGRLVAFDGSVLHGVIPGKGVNKAPSSKLSNDNTNNNNNNGGRRVTLMMAFWKDIAIRDKEPGHGSARPFPIKNNNTNNKSSNKAQQPEWAKALMANVNNNNNKTGNTAEKLEEEAPMPLRTVYETLDGEPWTAKDGMPDYETVFQGF